MIYAVREHINPSNGDVFFYDFVADNMHELYPIGSLPAEYHLYCLNNSLIRSQSTTDKQRYYTSQINVIARIDGHKNALARTRLEIINAYGKKPIVNRITLTNEMAKEVRECYQAWKLKNRITIKQGRKIIRKDTLEVLRPAKKAFTRKTSLGIKVFNVIDGKVYHSKTEMARLTGLHFNIIDTRIGIARTWFEFQKAKMYKDFVVPFKYSSPAGVYYIKKKYREFYEREHGRSLDELLIIEHVDNELTMAT